MINEVSSLEAVEIKKFLEKIDADIFLRYIFRSNYDDKRLILWEEYKQANRNSLEFFEYKNKQDYEDKDIDLISSHNFFIYFHHNLYFSIPIEVYRITKKFAGITLIITEKSYNLQLLERLANNIKVKVRLIKIDKKGLFVRDVLRSVRDNYAIFMLVDLPYSLENKQTKEFL